MIPRTGIDQKRGGAPRAQGSSLNFVAGGRGFSLIDLLVSMGVIVILLSILAPSMGRVAEYARRVQSASNLQQIGLGLRMWVDDHDGRLPTSVFAETDPDMRDPTNMMVLHLGGGDPKAWDGLGKIFGGGYLSAWPVFYCPNHHGDHPEEKYADRWVRLGREIVGNYQYRIFDGLDLNLSRHTEDVTIVSDGLRTVSDYNHRVGNNMLKADLSVRWWDDGESVVAMLPVTDSQLHLGFDDTTGVWARMDLRYNPTFDLRPDDPYDTGRSGGSKQEFDEPQGALRLKAPSFIQNN